MNKAFSGQIFLITGATGAIGSAVARLLNQLGAQLILSSKRRRALEILHDELIATESAPPPVLYPANHMGATLADYEDMAECLREQFGKLDGLILCSGVAGRNAPLEHYGGETWAEVLHINLSAQFLLTRALLPILRLSEHSRLVYLNNGDVAKDPAYFGAYAVANAALTAMMQTLAAEQGNESKLSIIGVDPSPVASRLRGESFPSEDRSLLVAPEDAAQQIVDTL